MIDIDAIPLDLPTQPVQQPVITLYEATVVSMSNGSVRLLPHHKGVFRQWARKPDNVATPGGPRSPTGREEGQGRVSGQGEGACGL
jgi:hypothetical protein